ncbi:hypothetical protein ACWGJ2_01135 [Streptomyces sp. NPDC054796]
MVSVRTYGLWEHLAMSEDLPDEALPAVVEALCATSRSWYGVDDRGEEWRKRALEKALPSLLSRATAPEQRRRLLAQCHDKQLADLAGQGVVTAADLSAILRTHRPTPGLIIGVARHADQLDHAIGLLSHLHDIDLEHVVTDWNPHRYRPNAEPFPPVPPALVDAVLEYALAPLVHLLEHPGQHEGWKTCERSMSGMPLDFGEGPAWRILTACPERWPALVQHPALGTAVQHLLLDHAETEAHHHRPSTSGGSCSGHGTEEKPSEQPEPALTTDMLQACLPALCLTEMAALPKPSVTARVRLHRIAERLRHNPRLADIAGEQLHATADECVRRGHLLSPPRTVKEDHGYKNFTLAEDLALLSTNPTHLAKSCVLLGGLEQPRLVATPPSPRLARIGEGFDFNTPVRLLQHNFQHRRAEALTALAGNPHTPRTALTEALSDLHPAELAWIGDQDNAPKWLREAAAKAAPAQQGDGILRLLTDDELDRRPGPAAVLQSWLDACKTDSLLSRDEVHDTVLRSRHHSIDHLRQIPADTVLTWGTTEIASLLLARCGTVPRRWNALLTGVGFDPGTKDITFGELLDSLEEQTPTS